MLRDQPRSTLFPYTTLFRSYTADTGEVRVHTGLTPILELGVGWNPELDAIDNVFLIGTLMGLSIASDRKSTRLNSSHMSISYAVFCLKKKIKKINILTQTPH